MVVCVGMQNFKTDTALLRVCDYIFVYIHNSNSYKFVSTYLSTTPHAYQKSLMFFGLNCIDFVGSYFYIWLRLHTASIFRWFLFFFFCDGMQDLKSDTTLLVVPKEHSYHSPEGTGSVLSPQPGDEAAVHLYMYIYVYIHLYMYIYMHVYIYVYIYMYICIYIHIPGDGAVVHLYMYIYMYIYICTCICTYMYVYIYTYINICIYVHAYTYIYMYILSPQPGDEAAVHLHIHIYMYIYTHTYVCIHSYMYVCIYTCICIYVYMHS